ncbi:hypothetical protein AB0J82_08355 [Asanoa sp. NPDC049518]|uniref:WXG100-like domain-containing protein n=1 Tax=unclassified Asanoa TaxID=2685164 RepID=UPI00341D24D7
MTVLPSPIPHPLDTLPWDGLPGWAYECLEWVIGVQWPEGDERAVWNVAEAWYAASAQVSEVLAESSSAASAVSAAYAGPAASAFAEEWRELSAGLSQLPNAFATLGTAVESCGAEIEAAKIEVWIEVVLLAIELLALVVAMALTAGAASPAAAAAAAATRAAIHRIFGRLISRLSRPVARVLFAGVAESAQEAGTSAGIQSYQRAAGHRDLFDLRAVGMSAVGGFAGGVAGSAGHLAPNPAAGLAAKAGRSAASESLAETAASLATGSGLPDPTEAARAAASGATSGTVDHRLASLDRPIEVGSGVEPRPVGAGPDQDQVDIAGAATSGTASGAVDHGSAVLEVGLGLERNPFGAASDPDRTGAGQAATAGSTGGTVDDGSAVLDKPRTAGFGLERDPVGGTSEPDQAGGAQISGGAVDNGTRALEKADEVQSGLAAADLTSSAGTRGDVALEPVPSKVEAGIPASPFGGADAGSVQHLAAGGGSEGSASTVSGALRPVTLGADGPAAVVVASADVPGGNQPGSPSPADVAGTPVRTSPTDAGAVAGLPQQSLSPTVVTSGAVASNLPPQLAVMFGDPTQRQLRAIGVGSATYSDLGVDPSTLSAAERSLYERALPKVAMLRTDQIRFTQRSISPTHESQPTKIQPNGWKGPPIHGVRWGDGTYVTLDDKLLRAARTAGLERIPVVVHSPSERLADWPDEWPPDHTAAHPLRDDIRELPDGTWFAGGDEGPIRHERGAVAVTFGELALYNAAHQRSLLPVHLFGTERTPVVLGWAENELDVDLDAEERRVLDGLRAAAEATADEIQAELVSVAARVSAMLEADPPLRLDGTDQRIKSLASLARKYDDEARATNDSVEQFAEDVNDVLRFSMVVPGDSTCSPAVRCVLRSLADLGYSTDGDSLKNFWSAGNRFYGLNLTLRAPGGQQLELQLPTTDSQRAGKLTHGLYQVVRTNGPPGEFGSSPRRVHAFLRTLAVNQQLRLAERIPPGLAELAQPRNTSFAKWIRRKPDVWGDYRAWLESNGLTFAQIVHEFGLDPADFPVDDHPEGGGDDVPLLRRL